MADDNKTTYNPDTGRYGVGKFSAPGTNLRTGQKAGAVARYAKDEYASGIKQGFSDIGRDLRQSFGISSKKTSGGSSSRDTNISSPTSSSIAGQTKLQSSSLLSIDAKLEDIVISQRSIQQDVNRLVFLVEELKSVSRNRDYGPTPDSSNNNGDNSNNEKGLLETLLDSISGPDRRRSRNTPRPRPPVPRPTATSGILNTVRAALFNPITAGMAGAGVATAGAVFGSAALGDYVESQMGTKEKIKEREGTEEYQQLQQTQQQLTERARARQGLATEGGASPGGSQRLTDEQKKQWLALPAEEKRKFQNNPTEWLKSQQSGDNTEILLSFSESTSLSNVLTNYSVTNRKTGEVFSKENGLPLINYLKIKKLSEKLSLFRGELRNSPEKKEVIKELQEALEEAKQLTKQTNKNTGGSPVSRVSASPVTTVTSSAAATQPSSPSTGATAGVATSTLPSPSAPVSVSPATSRSASDTTTSQTTASERGLRQAENARQGEDVRLNVKSYDLDSKGPLLFKSPSITFETDKLEFIFREKVEKRLTDPASPSSSGARGNAPVGPEAPPSSTSGPSAMPSPSTGGSASGMTGSGGTGNTPSGTQSSTSGAVSNSVQDTSIPVQGRGLLNEIARTEGGNLGYNAINYVAARTYGRTFSDFSKHPFQGQKGYTAAGRYQFIWTTWNSVAKELNITDFSPKSQDAGCWHLAKKLYSRYGNLEEDLKNPQKYDLILQVLRGTWHGLKNSNSRTLADEIRKAGLNTNQQQTSAATPVSASPATSVPAASSQTPAAGGGASATPTGGGGVSVTPDTPSGAISAESATPGGAEKQDASPAESAPGQPGADAGAARPGGGGGNVRQAQSGIRKLPISDKLNSVLQQAARAAGVDVTVTSGGQPGYPKGPRTGSTRHDHGNAADLDLYVGGRILSDRNPADIELKKKFVAAATAAGASGVGAGYMGPTKIHVGFGTPAKWGGAPWLSGITPGSGAGATTTPSGGAAGGGGGGATPMGVRGFGGGMTPMGGGGMVDPGAAIGGMLGGMLGGRKFGGLAGLAGSILGSALTNMLSSQSGGSGGSTGAASKGSSTEEGLTSAPMPPPKPEFLKGEAITSMLPDSFKNIMTDATTLNTTPDQSMPLLTTLPDYPKMKPLTPENAPVQIPNVPQVDNSGRSVMDYNNNLAFMAGPPEDFFSASGFTSVTPDPNFYGPGGKSSFSAGRLA